MASPSPLLRTDSRLSGTPSRALLMEGEVATFSPPREAQEHTRAAFVTLINPNTGNATLYKVVDLRSGRQLHVRERQLDAYQARARAACRVARETLQKQRNRQYTPSQAFAEPAKVLTHNAGFNTLEEARTNTTPFPYDGTTEVHTEQLQVLNTSLTTQNIRAQVHNTPQNPPTTTIVNHHQVVSTIFNILLQTEFLPPPEPRFGGAPHSGDVVASGQIRLPTDVKLGGTFPHPNPRRTPLPREPLPLSAHTSAFRPIPSSTGDVRSGSSSPASTRTPLAEARLATAQNQPPPPTPWGWCLRSASSKHAWFRKQAPEWTRDLELLWKQLPMNQNKTIETHQGEFVMYLERFAQR